MKTKKIYINGGMLIKTPYFRFPNAGAKYEKPPEGAEIMECNEEIEGHPCIVVDENNAPSIFNEYYTRTFLTSIYKGAPFLFKSNEDNYEEYKCRIAEMHELTKIPNISVDIKQILFRQVYLGIVTAVDTFVCDTILSKLSNSKEYFYKYINDKNLCRVPGPMLEDLNRMWNNNEMGNTEQKVFDCILRTSYCNITRIKQIYLKLFGISIDDINNKMKQHFEHRHLIVHKNGRKKNGEIYTFSEKDINELISETDRFVKQIMDKLTNSESNSL